MSNIQHSADDAPAGIANRRRKEGSVLNRNTWRAIAASAAGVLLLSACGGGEVPPSAFPGVMVEGTSAYLASNLHVFKYDTQTGIEKWRYPATTDNANPRGPFSGVPLKFGDQIVVGGSTGANGAYDRHLYAISAETGEETWRFTGGDASKEFVDGAVSDGKLIYAPNGDGNLYAIDPTQKEQGQPKVVWKFNTGNRLWSRPLLANGVIYQGAMNHKLYALDAATGKLLWTFEQATAPIAVEPILNDGVLYFGSFDSVFYAVKAADGTLKWKATVDAWVWTGAAISGDAIYFGDVRGKLYALDLATGQRRWYFEARDSIKATPVISNNKLYMVSMDTFAYAIDLVDVKPDSTGKLAYDSDKVLWRNETLTRRLLSTPVLMNNGIMLIPLFDGDIKLWSLDVTGGARKLQFPPAPVATPTPGK
jgi:outer membrane protein assembly factor BamB